MRCLSLSIRRALYWGRFRVSHVYVMHFLQPYSSTHDVGTLPFLLRNALSLPIRRLSQARDVLPALAPLDFLQFVRRLALHQRRVLRPMQIVRIPLCGGSDRFFLVVRFGCSCESSGDIYFGLLRCRSGCCSRLGGGSGLVFFSDLMPVPLRRSLALGRLGRLDVAERQKLDARVESFHRFHHRAVVESSEPRFGRS